MSRRKFSESSETTLRFGKWINVSHKQEGVVLKPKGNRKMSLFVGQISGAAEIGKC
mgnify:CR=1 FL=1